MSERLIFHIDVNSAYLSWSAAEKLKQGSNLDLREIPSIIGGDMASRHGVVLAKSIPAKAFGITTGEPVAHALQKCPRLVLEPPNHKLYAQYSQRLMALLIDFCPLIEQVSIDECYMDFTEYRHRYSAPTAAAEQIKDTVKVHTLFPEEIEAKMWPLPVRELFMVGRASAATLEKLEILTIGDLARMDPRILESHMKKHGRLIWEFANGIDHAPVQTEDSELKGVGDRTTLAQNAETSEDAKRTLHALCRQVSSRLRKYGQYAGMVSTEIRYASFTEVSHQRQLTAATADAETLYHNACLLFDELWNGEPIRLLGVRTSKLTDTPQPVQMTVFDYTAN